VVRGGDGDDARLEIVVAPKFLGALVEQADESPRHVAETDEDEVWTEHMHLADG
jgi:hypothetical protein